MRRVAIEFRAQGRRARHALWFCDFDGHRRSVEREGLRNRSSPHSLREPIKETGDFTVNVRLHRDVTLELPVTVTGEGGAQTTSRATSSAGEAVGTGADAAPAPTADQPDGEASGENKIAATCAGPEK